MEYPTGDCMNAAIESWRDELAAQTGLTTEIRRELEAHLHDCMTGFQKLGLSEFESFQMARQRMGQPKQLGAEFNKAMKTKSSWSRILMFGAWTVFIISFFLPALNGTRGFICALMQPTFWQGALQGNSFSIHYEFLTLANLLMLASPLLFTRFFRQGWFLRWGHFTVLAATILVWAFVLRLLANPDVSAKKVEIGCFLWALSFVLLYASAFFRLRCSGKDAGKETA